MDEDRGAPSDGFEAEGRLQEARGIHERDSLRGKTIRSILAALPVRTNSLGDGPQRDGFPGERSTEELGALRDDSKETELGHWTCCLLATTKGDELGSYCIIGRHRDEATVPESLKRLRRSSCSVTS